MLFFMVDRNSFFMTDAKVETVMRLWSTYQTYRYDTACTFGVFLKENGIDFSLASPCLSSFGYKLADIDVCRN